MALVDTTCAAPNLTYGPPHGFALAVPVEDGASVEAVELAIRRDYALLSPYYLRPEFGRRCRYDGSNYTLPQVDLEYWYGDEKRMMRVTVGAQAPELRDLRQCENGRRLPIWHAGYCSEPRSRPPVRMAFPPAWGLFDAYDTRRVSR